MNPFAMDPMMMEQFCQTFTICRQGNKVGDAHGFFCGRDYPCTIQLVENIDIKNGDWITDTITGHRYYVKDAHPIIVEGSICDWMVKYQTEEDYQRSLRSVAQTNINIHSVTGNSIIGSQNNATMTVGSSIADIEHIISLLPDSDHQIAQELLATLRSTTESTHPVLVEGALSKFSDLLKKHTDLLTAVGGWAVQLLIGK